MCFADAQDKTKEDGVNNKKTIANNYDNNNWRNG